MLGATNPNLQKDVIGLKHDILSQIVKARQKALQRLESKTRAGLTETTNLQELKPNWSNLVNKDKIYCPPKHGFSKEENKTVAYGGNFGKRKRAQLQQRPRLPVPTLEGLVRRQGFIKHRIRELQAPCFKPQTRQLARTKTHWDLLNEEMTWTANDFHEERKWKKAAAKRLCLHIKAHFQLQVKRGEALKTQRYHKKRMLAAKIADLASEFWQNCRSTVVKLSCARTCHGGGDHAQEVPDSTRGPLCQQLDDAASSKDENDEPDPSMSTEDIILNAHSIRPKSTKRNKNRSTHHRDNYFLCEELHDFQVATLQWFHAAYKRRLTCVLSDEPGLGKTFATICFLNYILQTTPLCSAVRRHLVVVPDSRCLKWHVALQTQCPHVKTVILGLPKTRLQEELVLAKEADVLVIAQDVLQSYHVQRVIQDGAWDILVLDQISKLALTNAALLRLCNGAAWRLILSDSDCRDTLAGYACCNKILWSSHQLDGKDCEKLLEECYVRRNWPEVMLGTRRLQCSHKRVPCRVSSTQERLLLAQHCDGKRSGVTLKNQGADGLLKLVTELHFISNHPRLLGRHVRSAWCMQALQLRFPMLVQRFRTRSKELTSSWMTFFNFALASFELAQIGSTESGGSAHSVLKEPTTLSSLPHRRTIPHDKLSPAHLGYINRFKSQRRCIYGAALIDACQFGMAPGSAVRVENMSSLVKCFLRVGTASLNGIVAVAEKFCRFSVDHVLAAPPTMLPFPLFDNFVTRRQVVATLCNHNLPRVSPSRLCMQPAHWRVHSAESSKFLYLIKQVQSHRDAGERCVVAAYNQRLLDLVQEALSAHWIGYVRPDSTEAALDIDLFNRSKVYSAVLVSAELQNLDMPIQGVANIIVLDGDVAGGGNDTIFKDFASLRPLGVQCHALKISHLVTVPGTKKIAGRKTDVARLPKEKDKISEHSKLLQAITRAKKLDIHFLQRVSRKLLNGNVSSENLDQVPLDSNSEKTAASKDSRQPMSVLGIRICSELGAEDDDFHYFCDHRAALAWQNRLNKSRVQRQKQESEHEKHQKILASTMGCEANSLFFEIKPHETELPPLSYRRRMHAAGQYTLYHLLGREDQLPMELLTYCHPVPGSDMYESLWERPKEVRQLGVRVGYQHSASDIEAKALKRVQDPTASNKRRGTHKAAQNLPRCKRPRSSSASTQGRMWTRWEDDLLVRGVCVYGNNWDLLCDIVNQKLLRRSLSLRTPSECYDRCTTLDTLKLYPDCWELSCDFGEALMKPNELAPVFWSAEQLSAIRDITLPKLRVAANLPIFSSMQSAMTSIPTGPKLPGTNNRDAQFQSIHESHSKVGAPDAAKMPLSILTENLVNKKQREGEQQRSQPVSSTSGARWRAVSSSKQMNRLPVQQQTNMSVPHAGRPNARMVPRNYQSTNMPRNMAKPSPSQQQSAAMMSQSLLKTIQ